jgi:hypothetical protein
MESDKTNGIAIPTPTPTPNSQPAELVGAKTEAIEVTLGQEHDRLMIELVAKLAQHHLTEYKQMLVLWLDRWLGLEFQLMTIEELPVWQVIVAVEGGAQGLIARLARLDFLCWRIGTDNAYWDWRVEKMRDFVAREGVPRAFQVEREYPDPEVTEDWLLAQLA